MVVFKYVSIQGSKVLGKIMQEFNYASMQEYKHANMQDWVCKYSTMLLCKSLIILVFKYARSQVC